jgi:hypothetical protein
MNSTTSSGKVLALITFEGLNTLIIEHGIWFWIYWSYAITLIVAGLYKPAFNL